ncbi:TIR domain-containing protein [Levilactobacillus brevis]|nr:TIR domain-containing protein [Levilactobacillus brevis]
MSDLFISYQSADPLAHSFQVQLLEWAEKHWEFPTISFHEQHLPEKFAGVRAARIKRHLRKEIKRSHRILVIISRETWQSEWTDWEIATVRQEDKQVLAAKLDSANISPLELHAADPAWIDPFDPEILAQTTF